MTLLRVNVYYMSDSYIYLYIPLSLSLHAYNIKTFSELNYCGEQEGSFLSSRYV